jgi:H/ACA ribonucleoprotein complex subunit 4
MNELKRIETETDLNYGQNPNERSMEELLNNGFVIINKPSGPSSHQVVDYVKRILKVEKAGHSGTLDPAVTGTLVIALGNVTRAIDVLLKSGKEYVCYMRLHDDVLEKKLRDTIKSFVGIIKQMPPKRSAVKRQLRKREIYYIEVIEIDERDVLFKVGCQAGTYIRKLCTDIGDKLGTRAHMQELVRTKVANFDYHNWNSLQDLQDAYVNWKENGDETEIRKIVQPIEKLIDHLPKVWVADSAVDSLCHGAYLSVPGVAKVSDNVDHMKQVAVLTLKNELIGLGFAKMNAQNIMRQEKGVAVADMRVFMKRRTYPKYKKDESSTSNN